MKIIIKYQNTVKEFNDKSSITIGNSSGCDFFIEELMDDEAYKIIYSQEYSKYVLVNVHKNQTSLCNNKEFGKILVPSNKTFSLKPKSLNDCVFILEKSAELEPVVQSKKNISQNLDIITKEASDINIVSQDPNKIFSGSIEKNRIAIIKEIGFKVLEFKNSIKTSEVINLVLSINIIVLSLVCSFGITNFLLGLSIDSSSNGINLTTNFWFLLAVTSIVVAVCLALKYSLSSTLWNRYIKKCSQNTFAQQATINISFFFLFVIYILNLSYYKPISGIAAFFMSLLFVGALCLVTLGSGHFHNNIKVLKEQLTDCEYREDFETVIKDYRALIHTYVNKLSQNKIQNIKNNLLNHQMKMVVEFFFGLLTAPFLAYGVSNTLAGCFPEAASWIRVSGIRFSPIFLVLSTFLIVFAFFSFVRAFTIDKEIKGSEIIKFDGFHDYNRHGVNVLGLDSIRTLEKEKSAVLFIATSIILIEFTMNVSYFISEIGGDPQGMFLAFVTALVPTALLIAETLMLSGTMFKINNCNEILEALD